MASKNLKVKKCKCGKQPAIVESGRYNKLTIDRRSKQIKMDRLFHVKCIDCQKRFLFKSGSKQGAIETWNRGSLCE